MVVNFRVNHAPLVLTGETREMQENGTPAKCSLCYFLHKEGAANAAPSLWSDSFYPLLQKLQKQLFQFLVAAELFQIRRKLLAVEGNLFRRSGKPLIHCFPGFPPRFKNILPLCGRGWAAADDMLNSSLVDLVALNTANFNERLL